MNFKIIILFTLVLSNFFCSAQNVFNKRYTFAANTLEVSGNLALINDTIYIIYSGTPVGGDFQMFYQKISATGESVLQTTLAITNTDVFHQYAANPMVIFGDTIIYTGFARVNGGLTKGYVQSINKNTLDTICTKEIGDGISYNLGFSEIYKDGDSLILIGTTYELNSDPELGGDVIIIKTDLQFNIAWQKIHGGIANESVFKGIKTNDGGYLVSGLTKSNSMDGGSDGFAYKLSPNGSLEWTFQDQNLYPDYPLFFENTVDGYIGTGFNVDSSYEWVTGNYYYFGKPFSIKLDFNGDEVWRKYYSPPHGKGNMYGVLQIKPTLDGNFVILGMHGSGGADSDIPYKGRGYMMKITPDGDSLWYREYYNLLNEDAYNYVRDLAIHSDGGYVITGFVQPLGLPDTGMQDMWLVKTNCLGFDHEPDAAATWFADDNFKIILDNNSLYFGNCIINWGDGTSNYIYEGYDTLISHVYDDDSPYDIQVIAFACGSYDTSFVTVYPQLLAIDEANQIQFYVYPNPVRNEINFAGIEIENSEILIYSLDGKEILRKKIIDENKIDVSELATGNYILKVITESGVYSVQIFKE